MDKKKLVRLCVLAGVPLVLYHLIVFLIPFPKTGTFWVAYVFTLAAFAALGAALYIAFLRNPSAKSRFYGFPIARVGGIYFGFQLAAGLLFMVLGPWLPWWVALLIQAIALGVAAVGLVTTEAVAEEIQTQDEKLKKDVSRMRALQSKVCPLASQCPEPDSAAAVKALAEALRFSDPVSSPSLAQIEEDLSGLVDELQQAVVDGDGAAVRQLCRRASAALTERNRLCKLSKSEKS